MRRISFKNVAVSFPGSAGSVTTALENVSMEIPPGEFVALLGPSGCGKSTLLNLLAGLLPASAGSVEIDGKAVGASPAEGRIGYMLARDGLMPWRTALQNVEIGMQILGTPKRERHTRARELLTLVGLSEYENHYPAQLSHGMRQRVAVARTLATEPDTLLLDEPFAALDAQTRRQLQLEFIRLWEERGQTVLFVTHDVVEAVTMADRVVVMTGQPGRIRADYDMRAIARNREIDAPLDPALIDYYTKIWQDLRAAESPVATSG
jgi:NitT/TauT family transport system ATP-binding protein